MADNETDKLKKEIEELKQKLKEKGENQKKGMVKRASAGDIVSRAPFGYVIENKQLIPAQNFEEIEEIFQEFLTSDISLRQLSEKHHLSVNGLKKILTNFTYIGKVKFNNQIHPGNHKPIISTTFP